MQHRQYLDSLCPLLYNALEEPAIELVPAIGRIKADMIALGAKAACMSGSGSAVFGVFAEKEAAIEAQKKLTDVAFAQVCESI